MAGKYKTITKFVKAKYWESGEMTLSFKMTEHVAKALMETPKDTYVSLKASKENELEWSMYYKEPEAQSNIPF